MKSKSLNKSGWNPTRRNRRIGLKGHGQRRNNQFVIPTSWDDERIFWEKLSRYKAVVRFVHKQKVSFLAYSSICRSKKTNIVVGGRDQKSCQNKPKSDEYTRFFNAKEFHQFFKTFPGVAIALTSSIHPFEQIFYSVIEVT